MDIQKAKKELENLLQKEEDIKKLKEKWQAVVNQEPEEEEEIYYDAEERYCVYCMLILKHLIRRIQYTQQWVLAVIGMFFQI